MRQEGTAALELVSLLAGILLMLCLSLEALTWCWASSRACASCLDALCNLQEESQAMGDCQPQWRLVEQAAGASVYVAKGVSEEKGRAVLWKVPISPSEYATVPVTMGYAVVTVGVAVEYQPLTPFGQAALLWEGAGKSRLRAECWLSGISDRGMEGD